MQGSQAKTEFGDDDKIGTDGTEISFGSLKEMLGDKLGTELFQHLKGKMKEIYGDQIVLGRFPMREEWKALLEARNKSVDQLQSLMKDLERTGTKMKLAAKKMWLTIETDLDLPEDEPHLRLSQDEKFIEHLEKDKE